VNRSTDSGAGTFITLEGVDGSGKTTQAGRLAERLRAEGYAVVITREPGGTPVAERIRAILLDPEAGEMAWSTEVMLYLASRAEHVARVIRPALERDEIVICDRFLDSTLAYQAFGREGGGHKVEAALEAIRRANALATDGSGPELTFLLDLDPTEGLGRLQRRDSAPDRLEGEGSAFLARVREGFLFLARAEPDRFVVLDGGGAAEDIAARIAEVTLNHVRRT